MIRMPYNIFFEDMKEITSYSDDAIDTIFEFLDDFDEEANYDPVNMSYEFKEYNNLKEACKDLDMTAKEIDEEYTILKMKNGGVVIWIV
jgi:hypothetical protein